MQKKLLVIGYWLLVIGYCSLSIEYRAVNTTYAQSETIRIVGLDTSQFPQIQFRLAGDEPIVNLEGLTLRENGVPIADFTVNPVPVGIDLVFVLDANESIHELDGGENSRLNYVQGSIGRFAAQFMSPGGFDRISVVVPDEEGADGRFLLQDATTPDEVTDAVYGYNPTTPGPTPLNEMMRLAVDHMAEIQQDGRFQAIFLLSDAIQIGEQLKVESLVSDAQTIQLPFFVAVLGAVPTFAGVDNAALLYEPTGGDYLSLSDAEEADPFYRRWLAQSNQPQITYQSPQKLNGRYPLSVTLGQLTITAEYELNLQPPVITLQLAETTVRRLGERPDSLLSDLEPMRQDVWVQVEWPDGVVRPLKSATLFVNGQAQPPLPVQQPDENGLITLDWNFRYLDAGPYELTAQVIDDLGWAGMSEPVEVRIVVERPIPVPPTPIPTPIPPEPITLPLPTTEDALAALGVSGVGMFVWGLLTVVRRRQRKPVQTVPVVVEKAQDSTLMTGLETAVLQRLNGNPGDTQQFNLDSETILIGRDMHIAQVVLSDKSVSRLHARIRRHPDGYWLYDEGSATGTHLNFERLGLAPRRLKDQDRISIGQIQLKFILISATADD